MVTIEFSNKKMEIKVSGHAEYDEKGKDIVCSAISILFYTLGESLTQSRQMLKADPIVNIEDGNGVISCRPKEEYEGNIAIIYWTILTGLEMLATEYPDNVKFIVRKVRNKK